MRKLFLTMLISFCIAPAFAQFNENDRALADKAFTNKDYYEAAYYYKRIASGLNLTPQPVIPFRPTPKTKKGQPTSQAYICYQLAESYRGYENYLEAESWYFKVIDKGDAAKYPLVRYWYGVCLRANQHFDEAIKQLEEFTREYTGHGNYIQQANRELDNCRFAKAEYQYPARLNIVLMKGNINADGSDYSMVINNSHRFITSSRLVKDDKKHLNRIYALSDTAKSGMQMISFKDAGGKKEIEYGTPSLDGTGKRMYLTRWYKEGAKTIHFIYLTKWMNNEWSAPVKLNSNVNVEGFNSIQPFGTPDGKRLFFSSNKPGGLGGDDIWMSDLDADGNPTNSVNLGSNINTSQDEEAPYYNVFAKRLVYSSKGFTGLGGFDLFESWFDGISWSKAKNLGYPMNSAKDDLYYFPDNTDPKKFYISSDRESDCCLNLFEAHDKKFILTGIVTDCDSHKALAGVKVSFVDSISKQTVMQITTGADAKYAFSVNTTRPYQLVLEKKGYFTKVLPAPTTGTMKSDSLINTDICLQAFEVNKPIVIKNVLYDFNKATLRPDHAGQPQDQYRAQFAYGFYRQRCL
jgi:OmpA-OmpF porin, OOP family